ncbi:VCBS repeat-containing protein, partial [Candidatus Dependentiae bacterium]|nr:VCBS repeat-containing protein [Candidatus Dependentiae bacterium]
MQKLFYKIVSLFIITILSVMSFYDFIYAGWTNATEPMGNNLGVQTSSICWCDLDNDGNLDLLVTGEDTGTNSRFIIFRNNNNGNFSIADEPMGVNSGIGNGGWQISVDCGDYDNDGDLDIAVSGQDGGTNKRFIIFRNNSDSTYTNIAEPMGINSGVRSSSIDFGDYDNDGDLDIAVSGLDGAANKRLIIFRNDGSGTFVNASEPMGTNAGLWYSSIAWGDYDNDGDLDLAASGQDGASNKRLIIFRNNGNNSFTNAAEPMGINEGVYYSSIAWGDYDNDGDLDLAVSGQDGGTNKRLIIFRNDGGSSFTNAAEPIGVNAGLYNSSICWGDYDNDGDLDLAVSGYNGLYRLIIFRNDGGSSFSNAAEPMGSNAGVGFSSIAWGDYDNDGDLDLAVSGWDSINRRLIIYRNDGNGFINSRPATPSFITPEGMVFEISDTVNLQWNYVAGDTTPASAMTYNLRIGNVSNGCQIMAADTDSNDSISSTFTGNVQNGTSAIISPNKLSPGTYYYAIQSVDAGMMNSQWSAEQTFTIVNTSVPNNWYVNISTGDTSNSGLTPSFPKKYIKNIIGANGIGLLTAGDTINIASGTYSETIVIDTDNIAIIGADSSLTIIDPPGDSNVVNLYGIYVNNRDYITIKNLCITGAYTGLYIGYSDTSTIENIRIKDCSSHGFYLTYSNYSNTRNSEFRNNYSGVFLKFSSSYNNLTDCKLDSNVIAGLYMENDIYYNYISGCYMRWNMNYGGHTSTSVSNNTFYNNIFRENKDKGLYFYFNSDNN